MGTLLARVVVAVAGAAVLIVETLAARLVAPYVGLTLESYSAAIGIALLGIAAGAQAGGAIADRANPRAVASTSLMAGGLLILAIRPIIHALGPDVPAGAMSAVLLIAFSTLAPVVALSIVPVAVVRARLHDIEGSGRVVGSLSALGTIGALAGTFLTAFVFVATLPLGTILGVTGVVVAALGAIVGGSSRWSRSAALLLALPLAVAFARVPGPCDVETVYYCARVEIDGGNPSGRYLWLDDLMHSYVDLEDPTHLEFSYIERFAGAIDAWFPARDWLEVVHIGGGAFTMPRYLAATRPGTTSTVLEIDGAVVSLGRAQLGVDAIPGLRVVVGDARTSLGRLPAGSADLVIGDAFGGRSVPWHLATREFAADIMRVLRPGGLYVLNVIDYPPNAFIRAELATLQSVFESVAMLGPPQQLASGGGNFVVVATERRADWAEVAAAMRAAPVVGGAELSRAVAGARVLTDEFAPVDQLLTPH